eukprot:1004327-Prorocentrum_minimum.AAC.3
MDPEEVGRAALQLASRGSGADLKGAEAAAVRSSLTARRGGGGGERAASERVRRDGPRADAGGHFHAARHFRGHRRVHGRRSAGVRGLPEAHALLSARGGRRALRLPPGRQSRPLRPPYLAAEHDGERLANGSIRATGQLVSHLCVGLDTL